LDGTPVLQSDTGYKIVTSQLPNRLFLPDTAILRKVILYPCDHIIDQYLVVDYQRKKLPACPLVLPFYPRKDDMVLIGDDPDQWIAKVVTVDDRQKSVRILYY